MLYKADTSAFWLPELVRSDLEENFRQMQDENQFWEFVEYKIGNYIFYEESMLDENGEVDFEKLTKFNTKILSQNAKGRLYVGPVRFLQKRVKSGECKRKSKIGRYEKYLELCYT